MTSALPGSPTAPGAGPEHRPGRESCTRGCGRNKGTIHGSWARQCPCHAHSHPSARLPSPQLLARFFLVPELPWVVLRSDPWCSQRGLYWAGAPAHCSEPRAPALSAQLPSPPRPHPRTIVVPTRTFHSPTGTRAAVLSESKHGHGRQISRSGPDPNNKQDLRESCLKAAEAALSKRSPGRGEGLGHTNLPRDHAARGRTLLHAGHMPGHRHCGREGRGGRMRLCSGIAPSESTDLRAGLFLTPLPPTHTHSGQAVGRSL